MYLTDAYSPYFAEVAHKSHVDRDDPCVSICFRTDLIPGFILHALADEDVLEQTTRRLDTDKGLERGGWSMRRRTLFYRKHAASCTAALGAEKSLHLMGTCAFPGIIPRDAIVNVSLWERGKMVPTMFDPTLTLANYAIVGPQYRLYQAYIAGLLDRRETINTLSKVDTMCGETYADKAVEYMDDHVSLVVGSPDDILNGLERLL